MLDYSSVHFENYIYSILNRKVKPYLRPMSSMTDEERKDFYHNRIQYDGDMFASESGDIDWLNAHHFDYRGLINKGLAIVAPDGMYKHFCDMDVIVTSVEHKDKL